MPRAARKKVKNAVYHVLMRGVDKHAMLRTEEDYQYFMSLLRRCKAECDMEIYGWCLLNDHVHLVVRERGDDMAGFFRHLCTAYACHYNMQRKRAGRVFQDRYRTDILETNEDVVRVLRHIYHEPVRLGLCEKPENYSFSGLSECMLHVSHPIQNMAYVLSMTDVSALCKQPDAQQDALIMDIMPQEKKLTDKEAEKIMKKVAHAKKLMELPVMTRKMRDAWLRRLRREGMSVSQITRLTGLGRNIVNRACSRREEQE